jgi:hypothetical protein
MVMLLAGCGSPAPEPAVTELPVTPIGQTVAVKGIEYTITGVRTANAVGLGSETGSQILNDSAAEGAIYVIVDYKLKNGSDKPMEFYERAPMHLVTPDGTKLSQDTEATSTHQMGLDLSAKRFSDLNPGITTTSSDVYEVARADFDLATWKLSIMGAASTVALQ